MHHDDLQAAIEHALSDGRDDGCGVAGIDRKPLARASTFAAERVTVTLRNGTSRVIFFKDLSRTARGRAASDSRLERGRRELTVYRHLLAGRRFDTPSLLGWQWQRERGRCWLLLEWAPGQPLSRAASLQAWNAAARWAARFHVGSRGARHVELACVPRLEALEYGVCVERLQSRLHDVPPPDQALLERSLRRFEELKGCVAELPHSFIHGELFPANIILRGDGTAAESITVVDWETAALGPGYLDLASLVTAHAPDAREELLRAYFDEYAAVGGERMAPGQFRDGFRVMEFVHAMKWASWFATHRVSNPRWVRWVEELRRTIPQ